MVRRSHVAGSESRKSGPLFASRAPSPLKTAVTSSITMMARAASIKAMKNQDTRIIMAITKWRGSGTYIRPKGSAGDSQACPSGRPLPGPAPDKEEVWKQLDTCTRSEEHTGQPWPARPLGRPCPGDHEQEYERELAKAALLPEREAKQKERKQQSQRPKPGRES